MSASPWTVIEGPKRPLHLDQMNQDKIRPSMNPHQSEDLATAITRAASRQAYCTIRFLVDRDRVPDAYRAYGYFRRLDDRLDAGVMDRPDRLAFVHRQEDLVDLCQRGRPPRDVSPEEQMLVDLIRPDQPAEAGLRTYISHMMRVMAFDADRRGRVISRAELAGYTLARFPVCFRGLPHRSRLPSNIVSASGRTNS